MVPEKTRAAQDETSEEQRSGKTPVREGRGHREEGSRHGGQPGDAGTERRGAAPRGAGGSPEMRALVRVRCSDSLFEWRVIAWRGSGQESVLCVPARSSICVN